MECSERGEAVWEEEDTCACTLRHEGLSAMACNVLMMCGKMQSYRLEQSVMVS